MSSSFSDHRRREITKHLLLWFVLLCSLLPFVLMLVISLKSNDQYVTNPWLPDPPSQWQWQNWSKGWATVGHYLANSLVTSAGAVLLCLLLAIPASYVIARYRFRGRELVYHLFLMTMFLPSGAAALVTTFDLMGRLNLVNSLWALILLGGVGGQVGCIFILRQFIEEIPREIFESAEIDGAGHLRQMWSIMLPLSGPALGTIAIMNFIGCWNNLILPMVLMRDDELLTVPVGLMRLDGEYVKVWGELMAGFSIASLPLVILFLFTARFFVRGLTAGAVKG
jgi:ABC-type glycerol-3-phosphate transport system permease component